MDEHRRQVEAGRRAGANLLPPELAQLAAAFLKPGPVSRLLRRPTAAQQAYAKGCADAERMISAL